MTLTIDIFSIIIIPLKFKKKSLMIQLEIMRVVCGKYVIYKMWLEIGNQEQNSFSVFKDDRFIISHFCFTSFRRYLTYCLYSQLPTRTGFSVVSYHKMCNDIMNGSQHSSYVLKRKIYISKIHCFTATCQNVHIQSYTHGRKSCIRVLLYMIWWVLQESIWRRINHTILR